MEIKLKYQTIVIAVIAVLASSPSRADVTEKAAIQAQVSAAMASANHARKNCPNLRIDEDQLRSLIERSGMTAEALMASEDYVEQRNVIQEMAKGPQAHLICAVLPQAHGGYARGIIVTK